MDQVLTPRSFNSCGYQFSLLYNPQIDENRLKTFSKFPANFSDDLELRIKGEKVHWHDLHFYSWHKRWESENTKGWRDFLLFLDIKRTFSLSQAQAAWQIFAFYLRIFKFLFRKKHWSKFTLNPSKTIEGIDFQNYATLAEDISFKFMWNLYQFA